MSEAKQWSCCPECGMVWRDGRAVCEMNGAGARTIPVDPFVGAELVDYGNKYATIVGAVEALVVAADAFDATLSSTVDGPERDAMRAASVAASRAWRS